MLDRLTIERALAASGEAPLAVALSGGGDSTALLYLLAEQLGAARLHALIVDHALREGSAGDAARALQAAHALGVEGETLTLQWPQGPKRAQASARRARYAALCEAARVRGARVLALGHNSDDQAETVLMRAAAGSGWRGLAGMAAYSVAPIWPEGRGVMLARPLHGARRGALREALRARGVSWIEDPANANPDFERVRVRARLSALEQAGFAPERLVRVAARMQMLAAVVDVEARALITRAAKFDGPSVRLDRAAWVSADQIVSERALAVLIAAASGRERAPSGVALARLDARLRHASFRGATLAGARISAGPKHLRLSRDPGALAGRADGAPGVADLALPLGVEVVWDGRLALKALKSGVLARAATVGPQLSEPDAAETRWLLQERAEALLAG